jgi:hypothetical protein
MLSLIYANQYRQVTRRVSSVVAYWNRKHGVRERNLVKLKYLQQPYYYFTLYEELIQSFVFSINLYHTSLYGPIASGAVSIPPDKFLRPPCWYYRLKEIENYDFRAVPNGIMSILNFIQIRPAVIELNHTDGQTNMTSPKCVNLMHIVQRTHNDVEVGDFSTCYDVKELEMYSAYNNIRGSENIQAP